MIQATFMNTITVKRASFLSSNYSVFLNGNEPAYSATVKFTLSDPKEIVLNPTSNRPDEAIHMKPVSEKKSGYGERTEYSLQKGNGEFFGFLAIEGRVNPTIRLLDEKGAELGVLKEKNALYSIIRSLLRKIPPNYYTCKNQGATLFTATEVYTPVLCSVKLEVNQAVHKRMDEFVVCAGLWIACTPSF